MLNTKTHIASFRYVSFCVLTDDVEKRKQMTDLSNQLIQKRDTGSVDVNQSNFQLFRTAVVVQDA